MGKTKIEWVRESDGTQGSVWNCIRGCSRVSRGCERCYAERMAARFATGPIERPGPFSQVIGLNGRWNGRVELIESQLEIPLHWRKQRRIFVNSMSDTFHENLPDETIDRIFNAAHYGAQHIYLFLTKRAQRMYEFLSDRWSQELIPRNWWFGVSAEDQATADERIPLLLQTPAEVRFISAEPLLADLDLGDYLGHHLGCDGETYPCMTCLSRGRLDCVLLGGESGPAARPCKVEWIRSIVRQCAAAGIACFVKQMGTWWARQQNRSPDQWIQIDSKGGEPSEWPDDLRVRQMPEETKRS